MLTSFHGGEGGGGGARVLDYDNERETTNESDEWTSKKKKD